ncbi:RNA 2',3'-cyclic phosphodiesterase [Thiocystis violacea]|uniref:RNA 2',3'-cyclic phosphodiesterase n=1 Tax=Thiocystis violacea TaxID=13725 RepID=UPI001907D468|nr:RNA 2',3'-cyclic phosphodiesterase [Thiocystis violacea]MBK1720766.1 RNA 2',3'-cyclic phosphodiesterase [Thiocystis violacea]
MAERWFLALWPDAETQDALLAQAAPWLPAGVRPSHARDLHLTLIFLGALDPPRLACVEAAAGRVRCEHFRLEIDRIGHFGRSRVMWCAPSRSPAALLGLVSGLQCALAACGLEPETRPYRPHLTLARKASQPVSGALREPVDWVARELVLAHGVPGARPRYRLHRRWPLIGADPPAPV